jgi:hypothetical protein
MAAKPEYRSVTVAEVRGLLVEAKAKEHPDRPWTGPRIKDLTDSIDAAADFVNGIPELAAVLKAKREAQAAVTVLRRVLPIIIGWSSSNGSTTVLADVGLSEAEKAAQRTYCADRLADEWLLYAALIDFPIPDRTAMSLIPIDPGHWRLSALRLFLQYWVIVGKASTSKNGPGVRFVRLALLRAGYPRTRASLGAIENVLRGFHPLTRNDPQPSVVRTPIEKNATLRE